MQRPNATQSSMTLGADRTRAAAMAVQDVEQRLSASESALLLGALFALAASMASFIAL